MKKILQIAIIALFSFNNAQAQLPNGSTGPDFTANDINGNSISLYEDFLDQGIPVILDISATVFFCECNFWYVFHFIGG